MLDRTPGLLSAPLVPRWGIRPFANEPAHGFFMRLAALNGQHSIRPFAMGFGINGRNIKPQEMLQFCEELPIPDVGILRHSTPVLDGKLATVRRQRLRLGKEWSLASRRYCSVCLKEASFHRFWFDIPIVGCCPFHETELQSEQNGMVWAWEMSPTFYERTEVQSCSPESLSFARYILGRLEITAPIVVPELDSRELSDVVQLLVVLGRMRIFGWARKLPRESWFHGRRRAAESGYAFLSAGGSIDELCENYLESSPHRLEKGYRTQNLKHNLGWLRVAAFGKSESFDPLIRAALNRVTGTKGAGRRLRRKYPTPMPSDHQLALRLGVDAHTVSCLVRNIHVEPDCEAALILEAIRDSLANLVDPNVAAEQLGISPGCLSRLQSVGVLTPVVSACRGRPNRYDRREIEHLLAMTGARESTCRDFMSIDEYRLKSKCSYASVVLAIVNGDLSVYGRDPLKIGLSAILLSPDQLPRKIAAVDRFKPRKKRSDEKAITLLQAAAFLWTTRDTVRKLIHKGVLQAASLSAPGMVDRRSVSGFRAKYVPAHMYSVELRCDRRHAAKHLRELGVHPPSELGDVTMFVSREYAEAAIGLAPGTYTRTASHVDFFSLLETHFDGVEQGYALYWHPDRPFATLTDTTRRVKIQILVHGGSVHVAVQRGSDRIGQIARDRIDQFARIWPEAAIQNLPHVGISLAERCAIVESHSITGWIESRATIIRRVLLPKTA